MIITRATEASFYQAENILTRARPYLSRDGEEFSSVSGRLIALRHIFCDTFEAI
jgi:hypothetical protein